MLSPTRYHVCRSAIQEGLDAIPALDMPAFNAEYVQRYSDHVGRVVLPTAPGSDETCGSASACGV
jgi:hypothetical protein